MSLWPTTLLQVFLTHHDPIVITELPSPYRMNSCHLLMGGSKPHSEAEMCKGFVILSLQSDYLYFSFKLYIFEKEKIQGFSWCYRYVCRTKTRRPFKCNS